MNKVLGLVLVSLAFSGCATKRKTIAVGIASAVVVGAVMGATQAPSGEDPNAHGAMWGGLTGAATGLALSMYLPDREKELKEENLRIRQEMAVMKTATENKVISSGSGLYEAKIPDAVKDHIDPGKWELYKAERWVRSTEEDNTWLYVDKIFKVFPPQVQ